MLNVDWKRREVYFDGATYRIDQEPALLAAGSLVVCGLGLLCDAAHDTTVAVTCVLYRVCEHDRFAIEQMKADAQGYPFTRVMAFHDRILAAVRDRRIDAFVTP